MSFGFIVCARLASRRAPGKALRVVNGKPLLSHLVDRLKDTGFPVVVAVPDSESALWESWFDDNPSVVAFHGYDEDPLARIYNAAIACKISNVIRVTHDKIFVSPKDVLRAADEFRNKKLDYLYSSSLTEGTGFEIMSLDALATAHEKFTNVEHVSYAIRAVTDNIWNMPFDSAKKGVRLLCDYEEDVTCLEVILSSLGNDCSKRDVEQFCIKNEWVNDLNRLPKLTIYTCAYNAEKWIDECMDSVASQDGFSNYEYLLIDDRSTDSTFKLMAKFKSKFQNVRLIRNKENLGLASSSNVALKEARGKFILRIDADDYFSSKASARILLGELHMRPLDAIYPANYFGSTAKVQQPEENHHVGGAIFKTSALNHIKFTEGIRGFEGLDLFARARHQLRIGYYSKPMFFYRQHPQSLSKTNLEQREELRKRIEEQYASEVSVGGHPEALLG